MTTKVDLISFNEAAEILGVSRRTIERLCDGDNPRLRTYAREIGAGRGRRPRLVERAAVIDLATPHAIVPDASTSKDTPKRKGK